MINKVLVEDWEEDQPVPKAMPQSNCIVSRFLRAISSLAALTQLTGLLQMGLFGWQLKKAWIYTTRTTGYAYL